MSVENVTESVAFQVDSSSSTGDMDELLKEIRKRERETKAMEWWASHVVDSGVTWKVAFGTGRSNELEAGASWKGARDDQGACLLQAGDHWE